MKPTETNKEESDLDLPVAMEHFPFYELLTKRMSN